MVADLHLGKVGHFRKSGIPLPKAMEQEDLATLSDLIREHRPETLLILGDFFHSTYNEDWAWIRLWRGQFPDLKLILVKGNHDILKLEVFESLGMKIYPEKYILDPFVFTHIPREKVENEEGYFISGHLHPGISIKGRGHQSRRLPCFYFTDSFAILPAFGHFTGSSKLPVNKKSKIFIINGKTVIPFANEPQDYDL